MITAKHTNTPWRVKFYDELKMKSFAIYGANTTDNCPDCICEQTWSNINNNAAALLEANANFIIKAVNNHERLVNLIHKMSDLIESNCGWNETGIFPEDVQEALKQIEGE